MFFITVDMHVMSLVVCLITKQLVVAAASVVEHADTDMRPGRKFDEGVLRHSQQVSNTQLTQQTKLQVLNSVDDES